jgi:preprotein translocase subunit YajC
VLGMGGLQLIMNIILIIIFFGGLELIFYFIYKAVKKQRKDKKQKIK